MKNRLFAFASIAFALVLVGAGCTSGGNTNTEVDNTSAVEDTGPIKIGWIGPLTGDVSSLGQDALVGAKLAVEEVNNEGGVNGRMLELVVEDGSCTPKNAASAATKLVNVDGVQYIVGGLCSGETTAAAPIAEENKVVLFSACSSAANITDAGDYIFRSYPSDAFQGKFGAEYVYNTLGKRNVAVLAALGDWGEGIKATFEESFKSLGGEVVYSEGYAQEERDFRTQLTKIKNSGAEVLYFPGYTEASVAMLRQAKELGLDIVFFGGDAWDDVDIHKNDFANGIMYTVAALDATNEDWISRLEAAGGNNTVCAPGSYNNVKILADAMKTVGTDSQAVKNELYNVKDYAGINTTISLDSNGDLVDAKYVVKEVQNNKSEVRK